MSEVTTAREGVPKKKPVRRRPRKIASTELADAIIAGDTPLYDPFAGTELSTGETPHYSPSMRAGLEAPRFCQLCGRRMVVQVRPDGWTAVCSRHGELDSVLLDPHR